MKAKLAPTSPKTQQEHRDLERMYTESLTTIQKPHRIPVGLTLLLAFVFGVVGGAAVLAAATALEQRLPEASWIRWFVPGTQQTVVVREQARTAKALSLEERVAELRPVVVTIYENLPDEIRGPADLPAPQSYRGNGILASSNGIILTTREVVPSATSRYRVLLDDRRLLPVTEVTLDPSSPYVFLSVDGENFHSAKFASREDVPAGIPAYLYSVTGLPQTFSVADTTVSTTDARLGSSPDVYLEQAEVLDRLAVVAAGNAEPGSAVANDRDEVIGLTLKTTIGGRQTLAPIWQMSGALGQVLRNTSVVRPWFGITYADLSRGPTFLVSDSGEARVAGVLITSLDERARPAVTAKSPAASAGLKKGDIITKVNSTFLDGASPLNEILQDFTAGETISVTYLRDNLEKNVKVTLGVYRP